MKHLLALRDRKRLLETPSFYAIELVQDPDGPCMRPASVADMHELGLRLPDDPDTEAMRAKPGQKPRRVKLVTVSEAPKLFSLTPASLSFALACVLTDAEELNDHGEPSKEWTRAEAAKLIPPGKQAEVMEAVASMLTAALAGDGGDDDVSGQPERPTTAASGDEQPS